MTIKIGDRAVYLPRVPYGRQSELFCFVSRVVDAERGIVDIITFPADGELQRINNVMPKGDGIQVHCWVPREESADNSELLRKIEDLSHRLDFVQQEMSMKNYAVVSEEDHVKAAADTRIVEFESRIVAMEAILGERVPATSFEPEPTILLPSESRRGPGRPRKDAA